MGRKKEILWEAQCSNCGGKTHADEFVDAAVNFLWHQRAQRRCAQATPIYRKVEALSGALVEEQPELPDVEIPELP